MPFQKGQSGNPGGRSIDRQWEHAIRAAGNVVDPKLRRRRMELAAEQVWLAAMAGDMAACNHVADRLDGKPHQTSEMTVIRRATEMSDDELTAIAAGGGERATDAPVDPSQLN